MVIIGVVQVKDKSYWFDEIEDCYEVLEEHLGKEFVRFISGQVLKIKGSEDSNREIECLTMGLNEYSSAFVEIRSVIRNLQKEFIKSRWDKKKVEDLTNQIITEIDNVY